MNDHWAMPDDWFKRQWMLRAPASLSAPFGHAIVVLRTLHTIPQMLEVLFDASNEYSSYSRSSALLRKPEKRNNEKTDEHRDKLVDAGGALAREVVQLRDAALKGYALFPEVEEEFGAGANGVAELGGSFSTSYVKLLLDLGIDHIRAIAETVGFPERENEEDVDFCKTFDEKEFLQYCANADSPENPFENLYFPTSDEYFKALACMQQEFFRAWKLKYPGDDKAYQTVSESMSEEKYRPWFAQISAGLKERLAGPRDLLFLKWQTREKMTDAKIRDRWDGMTDEERKARCPKWPQRVGDTGKKQGRENVKKAIRKAKKELGL
ncbi:MAG: hypothetical protein HQ582_16840 [Planctomycetes bacterium]|nr:hypothetical protein [Planctomycetota bacterium]